MTCDVLRAPLPPALDLEYLWLAPGDHESPAEAVCVMEVVSLVAGEGWSSAPSCVSPLLRRFLSRWNDTLSVRSRQELRRYICPVIGTRGSREDEERREWIVRDWLVRECAPAWLGLAGLDDAAACVGALDTVEPGAAPRVRDALSAIRPAIARAALAGAHRSIVWCAHESGWTAAQAALDAEDYVGPVDADRRLALDVVLLAMAAASGRELGATVAYLRAKAHEMVDQLCAVGGTSCMRKSTA